MGMNEHGDPNADDPQEKPHPLSLGHRLAEFELMEVIGEGGFGIVYRAYDHSLQREVAIKEYMPSMLARRVGDNSVLVRSKRLTATFDAGLRSFINEARTLAQFSHPALVRVHRFWESNATAYMATELYKGRTLRRLAEEEPAKITEPWLLGMIGPLLGALETLHRSQCFHRDIAPDNIFVQLDDTAVLLDFGAARKSIADMADEVAVMVKSGYSPIEQYADDNTLMQGPWTDLYALGAVLYRAVTGAAPPSAVVRSVQDAYVPLSSMGRTDLSEAFCAAVDHTLAVHSKDRTQTVAAFAGALGLTKIGDVYVSRRSAWPGLRDGVPEVSQPSPAPAMPAPPSTPLPNVAAAAVAAQRLPEAPAAVTAPVSGPVPDDAAAVAPVSAPARAERPSDAQRPKPQPAPRSRAPAVAQPTRRKKKSWAPELWGLAALAVVAVGLWFGLRTDPAPEAAPVAIALPAPPPPAPPLQPTPAPAVVTPPVEAQPAAAAPAPAVPASAAAGPAVVTPDPVPPLVASAPPPAAIPGDPSAGLSPQGSRPAAPAPTAAPVAPPAAATPATPPAPPQPVPDIVEFEDWSLAQAENTREGYEAYLRRHRRGAHARDARNAIARLTALQPPPVVAAAPVPVTPPALTPTSPTAAQGTGRVAFNVRPWGQVFVDGVDRGVSPPLKSLPLRPGVYNIEVRNGNLPVHRQRVTVQDSRSVPVVSHEFK